MASHQVVCAQAAFWSAAMKVALPELDREMKAEVAGERRRIAESYRGRTAGWQKHKARTAEQMT